MKISESFSYAEQQWGIQLKVPSPNVLVKVEGDIKMMMEGLGTLASSTSFAGEKTMETSVPAPDRRDVTVTCPNGLRVIEHFTFFEGCSAIRQYNTACSAGEASFRLNHISSAFMRISPAGQIFWTDPRRFRIHYCEFSWAAEAQWKSASFDDFGIVPWQHMERGVSSTKQFVLRSEGSWSTGRYYPMVVIEDLEKGVAYYMEHEGGLTWEIRVGIQNGYITIEANNASLHHDTWQHDVSSSESFTTTSAVYGAVEGGFEEAIAELLKYKRISSRVHWKNGITPVCYNVFCGGLYGEPTGKNLPPLIRAAAAAGCEVFCIDAGWYRPALRMEKYNHCGDYVPDPDRFGEYGLEGILRLISENGMVPGLWFEFEAANKKMRGVTENDGALITRNGQTISPERAFYDLRKPSVREHLLAAVDRVYKMGLRYIKNDYNQSTGIGFGDRGANFNEEARSLDEAFRSFILELYERYPDLIIENCGSGAMREDNGTLSLFHVQSTSDQEQYFNYPSIAIGTAALIPAEKAGNWTNPYYVTGADCRAMEAGESLARIQYVLDLRRGGEVTAFNMVTGQVGLPYMSGRLDLADEQNSALIAEGVALYKENRAFVARSYPIFPLGMYSMGQRGFSAVGQSDEERSLILLEVWKHNAADDTVQIDLSRYIRGDAEVTLAYPTNLPGRTFTYARSLRRLTVTMKGAPFMACAFRITVR